MNRTEGHSEKYGMIGGLVWDKVVSDWLPSRIKPAQINSDSGSRSWEPGVGLTDMDIFIYRPAKIAIAIWILDFKSYLIILISAQYLWEGKTSTHNWNDRLAIFQH